MDLLLRIDYWLFHFINTTLSNPLFDCIMPVVTNVRYWMPLYVIGLSYLLWRGKRRGRICVVLMLLAVCICDPLNSRYVKELVGRERPSALHQQLILRIAPAGGKSFPSTHATNNFAAALVLSFFYRRHRALWYALAALIAFSRTYVGVHFPIDVIAGAVEGTIIAWLLLQMYVRMRTLLPSLALEASP